MRVTILLLLAVLVVVCSSAGHAQVANPDLLMQAQKEGRVSWYTTVSIPESQEFAALFRRQFPAIQVDIVRTGSSGLVNRLISEYNAKSI
jgi:hypothetical protein